MTGSDFVKWAEACYGKYTNAMKLEVIRIISDWDGTYIDRLYMEALKNVEERFKTPPGAYFILNSETNKRIIEDKRQNRILERTKMHLLQHQAMIEQKEEIKENGISKEMEQLFVSLRKSVGLNK